MAKKRKLKYGVYDLGVQKVAVQQPDYSDVLNPAISLASAGSQFGPWGAVIGGAAGLAKGVYDYGKLKQGAVQAENLNTYIDTQNKFFGAKNPYETPIPVQRDGNRGVAISDDEYATGTYSVKAARAGKDIGKPGKQFSKIAASAAKKYGSKEAGERVAGAILARLRGKRAEDGLIAADEKPVEVERNELIFRKDGNGKFNLAADFKGGRTHEQGGEPYIAEEGDIIFPGKLRRQVMDAYNRGDSLRLNSLRLSLPKDNTPRQFKHGVYGIEDEGKRTVADVRNALEGYTPPQSEESDAYGVEPSFLDQAVTAAPSIYNIATGVFGKVQKPTRRFYSPESLRYEDLSAPSRQSALRGFKGAKQDIANVSGGSAATYLGNVGQAYRSYQDRLTDINLSEAARRDATSRYNVEGRNRAQMVNLELAGQYDIEEQQAREAKRKFVTEGLTGLSGLRQLRMKRKGLSERDALLAKALAGAF